MKSKTTSTSSIFSTQRKFVVKDFKIDGKKPTLWDLYQGFSDTSDDENGSTVALNGKLIIRPKFQRGYVVDGNKEWQRKLLQSVCFGYPLGLMNIGYITNLDNYCVVDGQQRLLTLFNFFDGNIEIDYQHWLYNKSGKPVCFNRLPDDVKKLYMNYVPRIDACKGTEKEMVEWFQIINSNTNTLNNQEIRNCGFMGDWCENAKANFSKNTKKSKPNAINGWVFNPNHNNGRYYYKTFMGTKAAERQEVLEVALDWASALWVVEESNNPQRPKDEVEKFKTLIGETYLKEPKLKEPRIEIYMREFYKNKNADHLISSYKNVIDWIRGIFDETVIASKITKITDWGRIYALYGGRRMTQKEKEHINSRVLAIMNDPEVGALSRVVEYVLRGERQEDESMLNIRNFSLDQKNRMCAAFGYIDPIDGKQYKSANDFCSHHIVMWSSGGKTDEENLLVTTKENHEKLLHGGKFNVSEVKDAKKRLIECVKNGTPEKYVPLVKNA